MILTLLAVSLNDKALTRPITARFDTHGGTIGRADHSTMSLPDPERVISRKQAEVVFVGDGFMIRNVGAANPINVAGRALAQGETAPLRQADEVHIGGYLLRADLGEATVPEPPPAAVTPAPPRLSTRPGVRPAGPASLAPSPPLASDNPFADLLGSSAAAANPFAGLTGDSAPAPHDPFGGLMGGPSGVADRSSAFAPAAPVAPAAARLPDDFDPFASPAPAPPPPAASFGTAATDPLADLAPVGGGPSIDELFGLGAPARGDDPLARFSADLGAAPPSSGSASGLSTDPLALFGGASPAAAPPAPQRDDLPALHAAYTPPRVQPAVSPPPAAPRAAAAAGSGDDAALWQAFCEGAGVRLPLPPGGGAERMRTVGRVLRGAVDGALQLMAVRASTKHEMRAAVTQIQARSNNPLKFAPNANVGLEQLVQPPQRGFLDGPAAMQDAMHDLVGHSIGTVTGMRAAIEGMLDRFDPAALEKQLTGGSVLDSLLPMNRKARLWELYVQHHHRIHEEAQEDFHTLFGKAFTAAYEEQIERLNRQAPPP